MRRWKPTAWKEEAPIFALNRTQKRTTAIVAGGVVAVAALAGGIAFAVTSGPQATPSPTPTRTAEASPTPSPTPTPEPVALPASVPAQAAINGWQGAAQTQIADVMPQVGDAADGQVSAYVDAPVVDEPSHALTTTVAVEPGATYAFSAQVRAAAPLPTDVPAAITIGDARVELPELDAQWQTVEAEFTAAADQTEVSVGVLVEGPVSGLGVDQVVLADAGGGNVVPNPSFEELTAERGIVNDSLVLREKSAVLAVNMAAGDASWRVTRGDGSVVKEGRVGLREGVSAVPLTDVTQGYYEVAVTDASGGAVSTPLAVVDFEGSRIAPDDRLGVATHADQTWYQDAADAVSAVGFGLARNDVLWDQNERTPGVYEFSPHYVEEFDKFHSHGIGLLAIVNYTNPLYDGGATPASEHAVDAFGRYAAAIAQRFDVAGLEVFNEFNHERFNIGGCGSAPACYLPLIQSTERHAAEVDPEIPIVVGSTANYPSGWFAELWQTGALAHSDAMSYHPYDKPVYDVPERIAGTIFDANKNMEAHGGERKPIWITEFGWTTGNELGQAVSWGVQAERLVRAETVALGTGAAKYFWYDLVDDSRDPNAHEGNFGMFQQKRDGVAALPPKPAAFTQALLIDAIAGKPANGGDDVGDGAWSYRFGDGQDLVRIAWTGGDEREAVYDSDTAVTVTDLSGAVRVVEPDGGQVKVTIGSSPVIIEGVPSAER